MFKSIDKARFAIYSLIPIIIILTIWLFPEIHHPKLTYRKVAMLRDILQIEKSPEILRKPARKLSVEEIKSDKIQFLIEEMKETMRKAPGVGLAAPQIGESIQLAVIEDPVERLKDLNPEVLKDRTRKPVTFHVIINPVLKSANGKTNYFFEGCLSVKNRTRVTPRSHVVQVEYLDENAELKNITAEGWYARILQHEIDHLKGRLYIDIADSRTELEMNQSFKDKWMNAMQNEIVEFYQERCGEKQD